MSTGVLSLGIEMPGREAVHSPPFICVVENTWVYTSTHPYVSMAWSLIKDRDNFAFIFAVRNIVIIIRSE
jgi:hypothetical protein